MTPVKVTVSLAKSVLADLDARAAKAGQTRSGFIANAVLAYEAP
jgi:metal-responsive CopG/Arc/MetJ family transcriptional regulator